MKRKTVRVALLLAVLAAVAAIPASTQVLTSGAQTANAPAGSRLPMLLVVNRLELSKTQMETLRSTIRGLLDQKAALDEKRANFETEMIAFNGTAEELDALVAGFEVEMAAARASLREMVSAAVDTLKETLTMKQGEILTDAFPGLLDRLDTLSGGTTAAAPQAILKSAPAIAVGKRGAMTMQRGQVVVTQSDGRVSITAAPASASAAATTSAQADSVTVGKAGRMMMRAGQADAGTAGQAIAPVTKAETLVERIRDRIARRLGMAGATTETVTSAAPSAVTSPAAPTCPMMGTMASPTGGAVSAQTGASSAGVMNADDFGTLTISLDDAAPVVSVGGAGAEGRLIAGLERILEVLELKLAAMK